MINTTIALTLSLAPAPSSPPNVTPPDFADQLDDAEIVRDGDGVQLIAYDRAGEPIGTIALWTDERGAVHLESDYDDGYASTIVVDGTDRTEATLPAEVVAHRAELIADQLAAQSSGPQAGWAACAAKTALAVGACTAASWSVIACGGMSFLAACECIPLIVPDDIPYEEC